MNKKISIIVGTRPNFIKVTQFKKVIDKHPDLSLEILHTGQHYDDKMSSIFFRQFDLSPDIFLNIPPAHPGIQTGEMIKELTSYFIQSQPDLVVVVGDVNSTLAGAIAANKCEIKLAHVESGLRSRDLSMPEENNRILTDKIADFLFVTEDSGKENLLDEGKKEDSIYMVGNTMIDTLIAFEKEIDESSILGKHNLEKNNYYLITMHRPSNVDSREGLLKIIELLNHLSKKGKVVFPIHPRTESRMKSYDLYLKMASLDNVVIIPPLDYFSFQKLIKHSSFVITDSGGIQEETTFRKVPCITLRENTERPVTCTIGTNRLMSFDIDQIIEHMEKYSVENSKIPELWDGQATERIVKTIVNEILN